MLCQLKNDNVGLLNLTIYNVENIGVLYSILFFLTNKSKKLNQSN